LVWILELCHSANDVISLEKEILKITPRNLDDIVPQLDQEELKMVFYYFVREKRTRKIEEKEKRQFSDKVRSTTIFFAGKIQND